MADYLLYALYGVIGILALIGLLAGLRRGVCRAVIRLLTVVASFAGAFFIGKATFPLVKSYIGEKNLGDIISGIGGSADGLGIIASLDSSALLSVAALPVALFVAPVIFVVSFVIISAIMIILHKILSGVFGFTKKRNNAITRILGMFVGALQGALVAAVILTPALGIINVIEDTAKASDGDDNIIAPIYDEYLSGVTDNFAVKTLGVVVTPVYNSLSVVEIEGDEVDVKAALPSAMKIFDGVMKLSGVDFSSLSASDKQAIDGICEELRSDGYFSSVGAAFLRLLGNSAKDGGFLAMEEPLKTFFDSYLLILSTTTKDTVAGDLETTVNILYILSDGGAMGGDVNMADAFLAVDDNGKSLFGRLNEELLKNPRMAGLSSSITTFSMEMLLSKNGFDASAEQTVSNVKVGINAALAIDKASYATDDEYRSAVSDVVGKTLSDNGIGLEGEELSQVTDYVINDMEGTEEVTDADIANFMAKYYDVHKN